MSTIDGLDRRLDKLIATYEAQQHHARRGHLLQEVDASVLSEEDQVGWCVFVAAIGDRMKITNGGIDIRELTNEELQEMKSWALMLGARAA